MKSTSVAVGAVRLSSTSMLQRLRHLSRNPLLTFGVLLLLILLIGSLVVRGVSGIDPTETNLRARLLPPGSLDRDGVRHLLGTDALGRDVLVRIATGLTMSLSIALVSVILSTAIGVLVGICTGYFRGLLDDVVMRLVDVQLAFPTMLFAIFIVAVYGTSLLNLIAVFVITSWVRYVRVIRSVVMEISSQDFVEAAKAMGADHRRILFRHLWPNIIPTTIVLATLEFAAVVLREAALSYLGLGVQPPNPSLGGMLNENRLYIAQGWWTVVFPGLAIMLLVLAINLLGDGLRQHLDPRLKN